MKLLTFLEVLYLIIKDGKIKVIKLDNSYNEYIKGKYQNNLIVMDNAKFHKSKEIVNNITSIKNKILNILTYNVNLNHNKNLFSQLKNHV